MTATTQHPWPDGTRYLRTGDLLVDLCYRRVLCDGEETELPQRIFDLLLLFLAEPGTLHTRAQLFERLWPGVIVEDANLSQSIWLLRKAMGEERKHWIRTVAKGGYVFEPSAPLEWLSQAPADNVPTNAAARPMAADAASGACAATALAPTAPASIMAGAQRRMPLHGWRVWAMSGVAAAALLTVGAWAWLRSDAPAPAAPDATAAPVQRLTVALIEVHDPAIATQWPVTLLHEWLGWKLESLPEVTLLTETELAAGNDVAAAHPQTVFLASSAAKVPGQILLHARFEQAGQLQRFEAQGSAADVPAMVDDLSRRVIAQLVPQRAEPWPTLTMDAAAARRYAEAVDAFHRRDWITAAASFESVIEQAPRFGLARLQLAQSQTRLAQATSAIEQMGIARDLLQPALPEVIELLDAQRLAVDPQRKEEAAQAYAKLTERYPDKAGYALAHAELRLAAGQPEPALKILASRGWDREPMATRIARLLLSAEVSQVLGDPKRARQYAQAAERMASTAGKGWELERGFALLQVAMADSALQPQDIDRAQYEQAAALLESAGNQTGALYARFLADVAAPPVDGQDPRMDTLLAKARAGGYRRLEMAILLQVAAQHHGIGDLQGYRTYLQQALATAEASGDVLRRKQLELLLLNEDLLQARFASADARLQRLRQAGLHGMTSLLLDRIQAALHSIRGRYQLAAQTLDQAERQLDALQADAATAQMQSQVSCSRAEPRLLQGDLAGARADWKRCASSDDPASQLNALLGRGYTELAAGDLTTALELLHRAQAGSASLPDSPDHWIYSLQLAAVLVRAGEVAGSDKLYAGLASRLEPTGYRLLTAMLETGLAENAAARGDWAASARHVANARKGLPDDAWQVHSRLDIVDAAAAWTNGERRRATALVERLHGRATALNDAVSLMEIHTLLPDDAMPDDCHQAHRDALVARSGMRGARLDWLTPAFTAERALASDGIQIK